MNEIEIVITGRDESGKGFDPATQKAKKLEAAVGGVGTSFQDAEKKAGGLRGSLQRVGEVAGGVLAADLVKQAAQRTYQWLHSTIEATSALGESVNAVQKTFGQASAQVLKWGESNAAAVGLSTRAFNQAATPLGSMLKNQGLSLQEVADQTIKLTQRAADMASVFNTDVSDALAAMQAGLRGEQDPLERYGVSLSAVAVEQKALADSGKTSARELTNQEKAMARLNLIYEQTASTAGDFADTADGLANAQRIATAEIENAKAKIGEAFVPVMAKAAQLSGQFAGAMADIPTPVLLTVAAVGGLAAAMVVLAPRIMATKRALDDMQNSGSRVQAGMAKMSIAVGKVGGALAVLSIAGSLVGSMIDSELNPQIDAATLGLTKWNRQADLSGEAARLFGTDAEDLGDSLQQLGASGFAESVNDVDNWAAHMMGMKGPVDEATERVEAFDASLANMVKTGNAEQAAKVVQAMADKAGLSLADTLKILPTYNAALETAGQKTIDVGEASHEAAKSVDELQKEFHDLIDETFGLEEAQDKAANAVAELSEKVKQQTKDGEKGAHSLSGNTQAARDNRAAVRDLVGIYGDLAVEYQKAGKSTKGLQKQLEDSLVAMDFSRAEAHKYAQSLAEINKQLAALPKVVNVAVNVRTNRIGRIEDALAGRRTGGIQGAATGGARGGDVLVGEEGAEIVHLPTGSMVYPHGQSMGMLGAGGGRMELVVSLDPSIGGGASRDIASALLKWLRYTVRIEGGGNVQTTFGRNN